ncbi:MAG: phosphohistidine phosphatase SixA [Myxococcales bacterium]|nr:phosphohistidine phosphatase SixA [Myxococcales bacterium]
MRIGILRHGIAEEHARSDFDRRLVPAGRAELARMAELIYRAGYRPKLIVHSPLVRAQQTALIVGERFPGVALLEAEELAWPDLDAILRRCAELDDPLLVGHEPTLGRLVGKLIGAPSGSTPLERAGFALVDVDRLPTTRPGTLRVFVHPSLAPPI